MQFLNADLDILSDEPLEPIRDSFLAHGERFFELYCGDHSENRYFARFEAHPENEPPEGSSAQEKLVAFCDAIETFPPSVMDLWKRSTSRVIDLGYQSEDHCPAFHESLQPAILQRIAALGIELAITIYPQSIRNSSSISLVD